MLDILPIVLFLVGVTTVLSIIHYKDYLREMESERHDCHD